MNDLSRTVLDTIKILETKEVHREQYEVCASATAKFDEATRELCVSVDSFVRLFEMRGKDQIFRPSWLPRRDQVRTHVDLDEAPDAAKEIFQNWTARVRKTIPSAEEWNQEPAWLTHFATVQS